MCSDAAPARANCGEKAGPDFDFGTPAMLATLHRRPRHDRRWARSPAWRTGSIPIKQGAIVWQYRAGEGSIWGGIQWGAAVDREQLYLPVSDIRTPKPGGLHAVNLATGERDWYQPPPPLDLHAWHANLQCGADLGADADSRRAVLGIQRRGAARAFDNGRLDHLGVRHQPRVHDAQRGPRHRRIDSGPGPDDRRRHAVPERRVR